MVKQTALPIQILPLIGMLLIGWVGYGPGPAPEPLAVRPLTVESMNRGIQQERLERQYHEAERTLAQLYRHEGCSTIWAAPTARVAVDNHLPPRIVGAMVFVESSCRPNAVSAEGAVGLTQVNPRVWHEYTRTQLRDPYTSLSVGTKILASYVRQSGLREGLHRYNGLGDASTAYSDRILAVAGYRSLE